MNRIPLQIFPLKASEILKGYSGWWLLKCLLNSIFKFSKKVNNIVSIDNIWTSLFYYFDIIFVLNMKSKIFLGSLFVSFRFSSHTEETTILLSYERTASYIYLKILQYLSRTIFQNSCKWLFLKTFQQTRTCSKLERRKALKH